MALETAHLSVITFDSTANQISPLTDLTLFKPPLLNASGVTSLGAALRLLEQSLKQEVRQSTTEQKGDWKPLIFLMTDGNPTDSWEEAADRLKQKKPGNIIACAAGSGANESILKRITEIVVKLENLQPDTLKAFFQWVSSSIKTTSQSLVQVMADELDNLPPLPSSIKVIP